MTLVTPKIVKAVRKAFDSGSTWTDIEQQFGMSKSTIKRIKDGHYDDKVTDADDDVDPDDTSATDAVRASLRTKDDDDVKPKEKPVATKKSDVQGGGQEADRSEVRALELQLDAAKERETELLNHIAILSSRMVRGLERIEELETAASSSAE